MPRIGITSAESSLEDGPPSGNAGRVLTVETDRVDDRRMDVTHKHCQSCGDPVAFEEPHVWAVVRIEKDRMAHYKRPVFCDRVCWGRWASRN